MTDIEPSHIEIHALINIHRHTNSKEKDLQKPVDAYPCRFRNALRDDFFVALLVTGVTTILALVTGSIE